MIRSKRSTWRVVLVAVMAATLLLPDATLAKKKEKKRERPLQEADLHVVDCLLPGQVRRLGRNQTYQSRRRPIRTTQDVCAIRGGEYVAYDRADFRTALRIWLESAEAGDAEAQYYVGEIYEKGLGTDPDYDKAAQWYRRAAEQGYARAQTNLGFLYEQGLGVAADPRQALEWYRRASDLDYVIMLDTELESLQQDLAETTTRLATLEGSMAGLQAELDASEAALRAEKFSADTSEERVADLEAAVEALSGRIRNQQSEIAGLKEQRERETSRSEPEAEPVPAIAGPSIEVFDASSLRTRSTEAPGSVGKKLVGRVTAPAGLAQFSIDDRNHRVEDRGLFEFVLPTDHGSDTVRFTAVDKRGKTTSVEFQLSGGQGKGRAVRPATDVDPKGVKLGNYHALVIGNANYSSLPDLKTAVNDAGAVASLLRSRYGYNVTLLTDATRLQVLSAFKTLMDELSDTDNLLVYYAGHGESDERQHGKGYWLPVDASPTDRANWVSSSEISDYLSIMRAKQVLVIADSCYSGALTASSVARFEGQTAHERREWLKSIAGNRVRVALTSGGLAPVLDSAGGEHSVFAGAILDVLTENEGALETLRLWSAVSARVAHVSETLQYEQNPQYAPIRYAGHESGEFVFVPGS